MPQSKCWHLMISIVIVQLDVKVTLKEEKIRMMLGGTSIDWVQVKLQLQLLLQRLSTRLNTIEYGLKVVNSSVF